MEASLMSKITNLATKADKPLIIIANPNKSESSKFGFYTYIASIGDIYVGFDGYFPNDLVELYADLKGGLESLNVTGP